MEVCLASQRAPSPLHHNVRLLRDAVKSLLDADDATSLTILANRLAPFRIDMEEKLIGEALFLQPVLILEDNPDACGDDAQTDVAVQCLPGSIATNPTYTKSVIPGTNLSTMSFEDFMDDGIPNQCAQHAFQTVGAGDFDGEIAFGFGMTHNEGLCDSMDLFADNSLVSASGGDLEYQSMLELESQWHASNDASMLDPSICSNRKDAEPGRLALPGTAGIPSNAPVTSAAAIKRPGSFDRDTPQSEPSPGLAEIRKVNTRRDKPDKNGKKTNRRMADVTPCKVDFMVQSCLRPDYHQFLRTHLPRWVRDGLWHNDLSQRGDGDGRRSDGFENLQRVYSCFCQLDARIKGDAIRSRMVMVLLHLEFENMYQDWKSGRVELAEPMTSMGRGNISAVIDTILEKAHPEWLFADAKQKAEFRAKFHNRKRHGKRWWMLMDALGPSVMILCSPRFAGAM
ncbi:hypothetical protein E4U43_005259 [Claviceps pusilla]|uniref:Uncharacterized protein n=1 Tax=Claviceps pusilla TaxID=123648 RepID=A0A9P7N356_9HYPO|nr:hypothetical protein E4U43_005259 [Claviceps pusilla]